VGIVTLQESIEALSRSPSPERTEANLHLLAEFRAALNRGDIRVAEPAGEQWKTNVWVKQGLILHLVMGLMRELSCDGSAGTFELDTLPPRQFTLQDRVRIPPGGSYIRDGAYLAPGTTCTPPVFVDIGAYIGPNTLLDSHSTVGTCAQIGARVQVSSGTHIGAMMAPPLERLPTIICDEVLIGGNCGIYGGAYIGPRAIIGAGTILTAESRVYDPIKRRLFKSHQGQPLAIPEGAIVVPGARAISKGPMAGSGLMVQAPIIIGYRDELKPEQDLLEELLH